MTLISYLTQKRQSLFFRSAPSPYSHKGFDKLSFKKKAFTLAEVLITLTIIGVVAAMTIPTLMFKYQKHTYVTKLKKAHAMLQHAVKMIPINEGCPTGDYECSSISLKQIAKSFKTTTNSSNIHRKITGSNKYISDIYGPSEATCTAKVLREGAINY